MCTHQHAHFPLSILYAVDAYDEDEVENPPVNPITGANRTYAMVREELRKHYEKLRVAAPIKPVFLSDFIFFNVQARGVQLGRVCHAPYGGALRASDTVDVTEHHHTPLPGFSGFFGTFKPLENVHFNKTVRGSLRFVRHRDVQRKDIVVFNVQMFGSGDALHVSLPSLRELQCACPRDQMIPPRLPATHQEQDRNRIRIPRPVGQRSTHSTQPVRPPVVKPGDRIQVYWTEDPEGWFTGVVTSSRKEDGVWVTRVQYNTCEHWQQSHHAWHRLDRLDEDHVTWRVAS